MAADGTIVIDTKIDADGVSQGAKSIKSKLGDIGDNATKAGSKIKSALGGMAKAGAKIGVAAITTATTAIVALTKQSVDAFAEYEQLAGGVEKIFDQMDNSVIFRDAANAYKTLGMSANEYLSVINNVGATFASTMGDAKGYETAKKGLQAISDFASGTGKSVDELSEKFVLITKSTSQYQSIADQFGGVLPATSADFLEQAQAAGLLSEKYTKLTEVPVAEYQQAVTAMLEKGVDTLGLTGNTAAEAASTLSGSMGMMSAAWKNLVAGFANEDANISELITDVVTSFSAVMTNIAPVISTALQGIGQAINELVPLIVAQLPGMIGQLLPQLITAASSLITSFVAALPELLSVLNQAIPLLIEAIMVSLPLLVGAAISILSALVTGLAENLPTLIPAAVSMIGQLITAIVENLPMLLDAGLQLLGALGEGIIAAIPQLVEMLPQIIEMTVTTLVSLLSEIVSTGTELLTSLINGIVAAIPTLVAMLPTIIDTVINVLLENLPLIIECGVELLVGLIGGIQDAIPQLVAMLPEIIATTVKVLTTLLPKILQVGVQLLTSLISGILSMVGKLKDKAVEVGNKMMDEFKKLPGKIISVGKDLVRGIWDGISSSFTWIKNKISGWVGDVLGFIKNLFGIHSPSKKTAYFGKMLSEGLAQGITANASAALSAVDKLGAQLNGRFGSIGAVSTGLSVQGRIPYLASGAVIPPRSEFLAVLGDQKSGTNIETPEKLLRQIMREELAGMRRGGNAVSYQFTAQMNRRTIFDEIIDEAKLRQMATGRNPFELA